MGRDFAHCECFEDDALDCVDIFYEFSFRKRLCTSSGLQTICWTIRHFLSEVDVLECVIHFKFLRVESSISILSSWKFHRRMGTYDFF